MALKEGRRSTEQKQTTPDELKEIARQLANPEGERGVDMGHAMHETNIGMIRNTIRHLQLKEHDVVLELGHGNANHLLELHQQVNMMYHGLDISSTMKGEAERYVQSNNLQSKSSFSLYDGINVPFPDNTFDKIFTVNTIYFWTEPDTLLHELHRVLKPHGLLSITFIDKAIMDILPFAEYGFTKYTAGTFEALVKQSQFKMMSIERYVEKVKNKMGEEMDRIYFVTTMTKEIR